MPNRSLDLVAAAGGPSHPRWVRALDRSAVSPERLDRAKKAFTTRRVRFEDPARGPVRLVTGPVRPRPGDLLLATVTRLGHHRRIELANGRRARLHPGDEVVVAYGDRYAPDQFEAEVPRDLGPTQLLGSGGVAGTVLSRHEATRRPTELSPVGLLADQRGQPLNLASFALDPVTPDRKRPRTIAVVGTSMNSGKTTTVGALIHGLHRGGGGRPGATKVTGTGSGADYWAMVDAGAATVADFTDVGLPSTYRVPMEALEAGFVKLLNHLTMAGSTEIVVEVADGIYQQETARLLRSETFRSSIDLLVFAAADSMGAVAGINHLRQLELPLIAVSGVVTRSPLAVREIQAHCDLPVLSKDQLSSRPVSATLSGELTALPTAGRGGGPTVPPMPPDSELTRNAS